MTVQYTLRSEVSTPFIQQIVTECLLCARHWSRHVGVGWAWVGEDVTMASPVTSCNSTFLFSNGLLVSSAS